jgi:hypothetical protein
MMQRYCLTGTVGLVLILFLLGTAAGEDACRWIPPEHVTAYTPEPPTESSERGTYTGTLRVYVTELIGRWDDSHDVAFHNAFLAFALEQYVSLGDGDTLRRTVQWDGHNYFDAEDQPFDDIQENNIKVIAAVFNSAGYAGYSDPPSGAEFVVHEVDACAGATPGTTGYNETADGFTHSVLVDDGSTTW